eukprot:239983-Chlamydomonas_euryale.AAC.4
MASVSASGPASPVRPRPPAALTGASDHWLLSADPTCAAADPTCAAARRPALQALRRADSALRRSAPRRCTSTVWSPTSSLRRRATCA